MLRGSSWLMLVGCLLWASCRSAPKTTDMGTLGNAPTFTRPHAGKRKPSHSTVVVTSTNMPSSPASQNHTEPTKSVPAKVVEEFNEDDALLPVQQSPSKTRQDVAETNLTRDAAVPTRAEVISTAKIQDKAGQTKNFSAATTASMQPVTLSVERRSLSTGQVPVPVLVKAPVSGNSNQAERPVFRLPVLRESAATAGASAGMSRPTLATGAALSPSPVATSSAVRTGGGGSSLVSTAGASDPVNVEPWLDETADDADWREIELARQATERWARETERERLRDVLLKFLAPRK